MLEKLPKNKTYYYVFSHHPQKKERVETMHSWASKKEDFAFYYDQNLNMLVKFKL